MCRRISNGITEFVKKSRFIKKAKNIKQNQIEKGKANDVKSIFLIPLCRLLYGNGIRFVCLFFSSHITIELCQITTMNKFKMDRQNIEHPF